MSFFRNTYNVLKRELCRIKTYPVHITLMVILPVLALSFFAILFSKGAVHDMPVAVLDEDKTVVSRQFVSMVDNTPGARVAYHVTDMLEAERMMKRGDIYGIIHIPNNFEKDISSSVQTSIAAYVSGVNVTANGMLSKDLQTAATTFSSGVQIQVLMAQGLSETEAYAQMMPVYFDRHVLFNPYVNYGYTLLPSFMPMVLMIFTILLTVFVIGNELKNRTAGEWFAAADGRVWAALTGKMLPYTTCMFVMCLFMNVIMYKWVGVPLNGSIVVLTLGSFMFILAYQSVGILIISVLSNLRFALSIAGGYSVLAFTFSGLTFPRMAMYPTLEVISYIFPFTIYTDIFVDQALRGAPIIYSVQYLGLLSLGVILPLLCLPRLKEIATNEKYWGKI